MSQATVAPAEPAATGGPELSRAQMNVVFGTILLGILLSALAVQFVLNGLAETPFIHH